VGLILHRAERRGRRRYGEHEVSIRSEGMPSQLPGLSTTGASQGRPRSQPAGALGLGLDAWPAAVRTIGRWEGLPGGEPPYAAGRGLWSRSRWSAAYTRSAVSRMVPMISFGGRAGVLLALGVIPALVVAAWLGPPAGGLGFAALGVMVLWFGLIPALRVRVLLRDGVQAQGTVVGSKRARAQGQDGSYTTYSPIVQFTTADGRRVEFTSRVGSGRKPDTGGAVPVRYSRNDPERAGIERASTWMPEAAFWLVIGLGLVVFALVIAIGDYHLVLE